MEWLTLSEAAHRLQLSPTWVRARLRDGALRGELTAGGSQTLISRYEVERLAADRLARPIRRGRKRKTVAC